jgi:hypothetical protein
MEKAKKLTINVLNRATSWLEKETETMKSKFETRFIKTIRTVVVLSCVLVFINVLLILRG